MRLVNAIMIFVGISGAFSVLFGAWLAHAGQMLALDVQSRLDTALQYQFIHTLALLATIIWYQQQPSKTLMFACISFVVGILCFSGSLYLKTFFNFTVIGKIAPLGGISFALGWITLALAGKNKL